MNPGVTIQSMQLSGDTQQRNALLNSLDNQHWLGESDPRIIFIRKISVSGYWWELAQKISHSSNDQVAQVIYQKNFRNEHLAVFSNYAELAADVIRNLLVDQKPWYLIRWLQQENLPAEPVAVLQHQLYELPAVLENLRLKNQLPLLFSKIDIQHLQALVSSLSAISPVLSSAELAIPVVEDNFSPAKISLTDSAVNWVRSYFSPLPDNYSNQDLPIVLKLISCLSAWKFSPALLKDVEGFKRWHLAVVEVYRESCHPTLSRAPLTLPLARGGDGSQSESELNRESGPSPKPVGGEDLNIENNPDDSEVLEKNLEKFLIKQTGLFFLLNLLKSEKAPLSLSRAPLTLSHQGREDRSHPESESNRESSPSPLPRGRLGGGEEPGTINPWISIHQLFQKIAKTFAFTLQASLTDLLISISHLTPEEFQEEISQENPMVDQWFSHLSEKLTKMNLWNSEWLQIISTAEVNEAYVNFYLDNSAVNLDLRMAGLDVNPGWVPWLGRVIYFHYGDYPQLIINKVDAS